MKQEQWIQRYKTDKIINPVPEEQRRFNASECFIDARHIISPVLINYRPL
jgi:hypothetical protein